MFFKVGNFPFAFIYMQLFVQDCHSGTVISAVFKAMQSFNKNGISFFASDITNYSAHILKFNGRVEWRKEGEMPFPDLPNFHYSNLPGFSS
jgi:hypothetical protein